MNVDNLTSQDIYFGPLHLPPNATGFYVDDTTATSLYLTSDAVADALNNAYDAGKIQVTSFALPFPRPTGAPIIVHGDGSPEGVHFASQGSVFMGRDNSGANAALYAKTTGVTLSTGWQAFAEAAPVLPATTLPTTPADGQQAILVDSTSAPTFVWLLQWSGAASKWLFLGGSPMYAEVTAAQSTGSTTYAALATSGPSLTLPRAGTYVIEHGFRATHVGTASGLAYMSYDIGGTGAVDADSTYETGTGWTTGQVNESEGSRKQRKSGLAASATLTAKYRSVNGNSVTFANRWISATPVLVT